MEDKEIIALYLSHSQQAILETQKKYGYLCKRIVSNVLTCNEDIEECLNDVYHALWTAITAKNANIDQKLSAFLCKIAKNHALKKHHYNVSQKRNPNMSVSLDESELSGFMPSGADFTFEVEDRETAKYISEFLRTLKFADRNIFLRKYFVGDSLASIMKTFRFSESKVKSSLFRTRNKLKVYLIEKGVEL